MKKVLATVMAVAMMLTMLIAMPVSAAVTVGDNLIYNGSFEFGAVDESTTIDGWTQVNDEAQLYLKNTVDSEVNPPSDGNFVAYIAPDAAANGLKQEITLDEEADWYVNQEDYIFELSARVYGVAHPYIEATVYNADKSESATQKFTATGDITTADFAITAGTMGDVTVGFGTLVNSLEGKTKYIEITIGSDGEASWDNIKLVPMLNLVENGSFEADDGVAYAGGSNPAETITGWVRESYRSPYLCNIFRYSQYLVPRDGTKMLHAERGDDEIYQEIDLDTTADYFVNQSQYDFTLSFAYYFNAKVTITAYNYDKAISSEYSFLPYKSTGGHTYTTRDFSLSISDVLSQVGKAAHIRITLGTEGGQAGWDHIRLVPVKKATEADDNMLENGGFEAGTVDGWTEKYPNMVEIINDPITSAGGLNYVRVSRAATEEGNIGGALVQDVELEKGKLYEISFSYKFIEENAAHVVISNEADGREIYSVAPAVTGTTWDVAGWSIYKRRFVAEEDCPEGAKLVIECDANATEDVYYDDVRLAKIGEVPASDPRNLIINGSFEYDYDGSPVPVAWMVPGEISSASSTVKLGESTNANIASDGDKVLLHGWSDIYQRVVIDDYDIANGKNYDYKLDFDYSSPDGGRVTVEVSYEFEDETKNETVIYPSIRLDPATGEIGAEEYSAEGGVFAVPINNGNYFTYYTGAAYHPVSIDLSSFMPQTESRLMAIKIQINHVGLNAVLDNFRLYPVKSNVIIVDENDGFMNGLPTEDDVTLKAKGEYMGTAEDAKLIFAQYNVIDEDTLELVKIDVVGLNQEGNFDDATLDGLTLASGEQLVKAYIIEKGKLTPVAMAEVK